ncbi:phosphotyrosine-specific ptp2-like protein [Sporothrix stenoceras]
MLAYSVGQPYPPKLSPAAASIAAQDAKTSSPSYFGLVVESSKDPRDSAALPRNNWSSPSSSVKSFTTAIPKQMMPLDANPAYEAFRRGADANNLVRSFSLGNSHFSAGQTPPPIPSTAHADISPSTAAPTSVPRPQMTRRSTQDHGPTSHPVTIPPPGASSAMPLFRPTFTQRSSHEASKRASMLMEVDADSNSLHDSAYVSSDSKRNSEASIDPPSFFNAPRFESPVQLEAAPELKPPTQQRQPPPHLPVSLGRLTHGMMDIQQLKEILDLDAVPSPTGNANKRLLLLDVRVATYYATSRIHGALNMCIPTTLLKRATFTLEKMQLTFTKGEDQESFAAWRDASYLVVYDNNSSEKRDATAALNMLRKFTNDGYKGQAFVLRGGFQAFEAAYPNWVDRDSPSPPPAGASALSLPSGPRKLSIAPILGGVMMPCATSNSNPFFSNIRQNMDLADGVGRIELTLPPGTAINNLPTWLRNAADPTDRGQKVSQKFLSIEVAEQARMKDAYGVIRQSMNGADPCAPQVQISGVEKGGKNRYKDILPFDHARVRLQGRAAGDCDYVNASHLRASRSNKRYIASQAPLPATFSDFWSMIWDEDVRVIVMLTAESEGGQIKCHPYWKNNEYGKVTLRLLSEKKVSLEADKHRPNSTASGSTASSNNNSTAAESGRRRAQTLVSSERTDDGAGSFFGQANSANSSSSDAPFVYIRKFALSHRGHAFSPMREVTQLHYPSWPDFGTPAKPSHLLALVELANATQRAASPPTDIPQGMTKTTSMPVVQAAAGSSPSNAGKIESLLSSPWYGEPENNPAPRPMLVHCSAGCGRTGAFCTVDSVVDMLKRQNQRSIRRANAASGFFSQQQQPPRQSCVRRESNIAPNEVIGDDIIMSDDEGDYGFTSISNVTASVDDVDKGFDTAWLDSDQVDLVAGTVEDFRTQRLSIVQSLRQYVLCYETITEWVSKMQERRGAGIRGPGRARSESLRMTFG